MARTPAIPTNPTTAHDWYLVVEKWAVKERAAAERRNAAVRERDEAIIAMRAAGATLRDIGDAAQLSHTAIAKILDRG